MQEVLEKWECTSHQHSFLVSKDRAKGKTLNCPYCLGDAESVAEQDPASSIEDQLDGCLFPR